MYKDHKKWEPPSEEATLWRYMDFTKFMDLIMNKSIYFNRIDKFNDPYEGHATTGIINFAKQVGNPYYIMELQENQRLLDGLRKFTFVNCWHVNSYESAAMWSLYLKTDEGIAIKTKFNRMREAFKGTEVITGGMVKYVDFEKHDDWFINLTDYFILKRISFEHEKEFRLFWVIDDVPDSDTLSEVKEGPFEFGINIDVDIEILIEEIYISPTAHAWFENLVRNIVKELINPEIPVIKSKLYQLPK